MKSHWLFLFKFFFKNKKWFFSLKILFNGNNYDSDPLARILHSSSLRHKDKQLVGKLNLTQSIHVFCYCIKTSLCTFPCRWWGVFGHPGDVAGPAGWCFLCKNMTSKAYFSLVSLPYLEIEITNYILSKYYQIFPKKNYYQTWKFYWSYLEFTTLHPG